MTSEHADDPGRAEAPAEVDEVAEARTIGHYTILRELGRGAQGIVFLAEDQNLHRKVALKVLIGAGAESQDVRERFLREAEVASRLDHPGICAVHEFGEHDSNPFIAMQYVRGTTLADMLESARAGKSGESGKELATETVMHAGTTMTMTGRDGTVATHDILRLIERSARALHAAHEAGLVHRDIKPGNIMITPDGDPVLLDFGLARDVDSEAQALTQTGQIMGTPAYLAPEQLVGERGDIDRRTDVYALGVTLFECLTLSRPFEAQSWNQLFQKILHAEPPNPRKLNPRIPPDLRTVIEVAMERDRTRRYATAAAFSDDLRRVRSFEPIQAKAAGPLLRLTKWSRRRPAAAVAIVAALAFVVFGSAFLFVQTAAQQRAFEARLRDAEELLAREEFDAALEAVAQARERSPFSAAPVELKARIEEARETADTAARRAADMAAAETARAESRDEEAEWRATQDRIAELDARIAEERARLSSGYVSDTQRGELAYQEHAVEQLRIRADNLRRAAEQSLDRAARLEIPWDGPSAETQAAFASFYMRRWREAVDRDAKVEAGELRRLVERYDMAGAHTEELLGRGVLRVGVTPAEATVHLFRYVPYEELRQDGTAIPRLVPVPWSGTERALPDGLPADFLPGDPCLRVVAVAADSPAHRAGVRADDLVVRLDGARCDGGVFLDGSPLPAEIEAAGVAVSSRIVSINGLPIEKVYDWLLAPKAGAGELDLFEFEGVTTPVAVDRRRVRAAKAETACRGGLPRAVRFTCLLRGGRVVELEAPAGSPSGLECEVTAYPLIRGPANRVAAGAAITVDPGSYLLVAEAEGHEMQRLHVAVPSRKEIRTGIELLPEGSTPPGFAWIPPGEFVFAGDSAVLKPRPPQAVALPGFWIARYEVTNREWFEFVNDPETLTRIRASEQTIYLPRDIDGKALYHARPDGSGFDWLGYRVPAGHRSLADTPALGVSWNDVQDYLEWRNARAKVAGEPWRYELPSEQEWEKAARGVDGRAFPWGDRFDLALTVNHYRRPDWLLDAPGGFEPCDESPYGIRDVAGSREEWTRDGLEFGSEATYVKRGGHWGTALENAFRVANGTEAGAARAQSTQGLRLVARRVE